MTLNHTDLWATNAIKQQLDYLYSDILRWIGSYTEEFHQFIFIVLLEELLYAYPPIMHTKRGVKVGCFGILSVIHEESIEIGFLNKEL